MRKIKYNISIGFCGCDDDGVLEVQDDTSDTEIDTIINEMSIEYANSWEGDSRLGDWDEQSTESFYENVYATWSEVDD